MKKHILHFAIVALMASLFISCNKQEMEAPTTGMVGLTLSGVTDVNGPQTRSSETVFQHQMSENLWFTATLSDNPVSLEDLQTKGTNTTTASFSSLYGSTGFGVYAEGSGDPTNVIFDNVNFVKSGQLWAPAISTLWPSFATDWYCWAPKEIAHLTSASKSFTYTTPAMNSADDPDILVSKISGVAANRTESLGIAFDHALCEVKFVTNADMPAGTVNSLSISGINLTGTYDFVYGNWSGQTDPGSITLSSSETVGEGAGSDLTGDSETFFVIPQTCGAGAKVIVVIGDDSYEIPLPENYVFPAGKLVTFALGEAYRINIKTTVYANDGETVVGTIEPTFSPADAFTQIGSESPNGITTYSCNSIGAQVTLTPQASDGFYFHHWCSDRSVEPTCTYDTALTPRGTTTQSACFAPYHALVFTSNRSESIQVNNADGNAPVLWYSTDGVAWTNWDYSRVSIPTGGALFVRGKNPSGFSTSDKKYSYFSAYYLISGTVTDVSGNIMDLLDYEAENLTTIPCAYCFYGLFYIFNVNDISRLELPATTLAPSCYKSMFTYCDITSIPENFLPATTLASSCYNGMFSFCDNLTSIPETLLPATTLASSCYNGMFAYCHNLTSIPETLLPAETLASSCYAKMFNNCTGLTSVPENLLPVTTLTQQCYERMFEFCTGLSSIPGDFLPATTLANGCYGNMFFMCTGLSSIPGSLLPATELADQCYGDMFGNCTGLSSIPDDFLPATTLAYQCYSGLFRGCSGLTSVPDDLLPATNLYSLCYHEMFLGCTSLTTAPVLPAQKPASYSYKGMFSGCSNLNYIKCLATDLSAPQDCKEDWTDGVSATGTFIKAPGVAWPTGVSGIPDGWNVEEYVSN